MYINITKFMYTYYLVHVQCFQVYVQYSQVYVQFSQVYVQGTCIAVLTKPLVSPL